MWGVLTPEEARQKIDEQRQEALERMKALSRSTPSMTNGTTSSTKNTRNWPIRNSTSPSVDD
jgi:hypothetical protein